MVLIVFPDLFIYKELSETFKKGHLTLICVCPPLHFGLSFILSSSHALSLGFFSFHFNSAVKTLVVLMRKPVAFMLSAKTMVRIFAANSQS